MKKETIFEVLTFDGDATLGFIKAYDVPHARRIAERLYCKGVKIKLIGEGSKGTRVLTYEESMER